MFFLRGFLMVDNVLRKNNCYIQIVHNGGIVSVVGYSIDDFVDVVLFVQNSVVLVSMQDSLVSFDGIKEYLLNHAYDDYSNIMENEGKISQLDNLIQRVQESNFNDEEKRSIISSLNQVKFNCTTVIQDIHHRIHMDKSLTNY